MPYRLANQIHVNTVVGCCDALVLYKGLLVHLALLFLFFQERLIFHFVELAHWLSPLSEIIENVALAFLVGRQWVLLLVVLYFSNDLNILPKALSFLLLPLLLILSLLLLVLQPQQF